MDKNSHLHATKPFLSPKVYIQFICSFIDFVFLSFFLLLFFFPFSFCKSFSFNYVDKTFATFSPIEYCKIVVFYLLNNSFIHNQYKLLRLHFEVFSLFGKFSWKMRENSFFFGENIKLNAIIDLCWKVTKNF